MSKIKLKSIKTAFSGIEVFTQAIKIKHIVHIYYVAVRGIDNEEGAVQRFLSKRRIESIASFILEGNSFFNSFIFNWTNNDSKPVYQNNTLTISLTASSCQAIDGQHRLAGLEKAMEVDPSIGENEIMTSFVVGLNTSQAANIFLNINSEQKPVAKTLIYDLFGEVVDDKKHSINRAADIARELNDDDSSPYYRLIKFPGSPRGAGVIDLSTVVSSLKKELEPDGKFKVYNLKSLEYQRKALLNYFKALSWFYFEKNIWTVKTTNPFFINAGFNAAIEHFLLSVMPKCMEMGSFEIDTIKTILNLQSTKLITRNDIKSMDGKGARKKVREFLEEAMISDLPKENELRF
jgi:DGQHR domain-containing protein